MLLVSPSMEQMPRTLLRVVARLPCHSVAPVRVNVVDVWVRPPLMVNGKLHSSAGEEVEAPSPPCKILNVGYERSIQFYLYGINNEVPNHSPCSLGL
jgi:hypothetical protein